MIERKTYNKFEIKKGRLNFFPQEAKISRFKHEKKRKRNVGSTRKCENPKENRTSIDPNRGFDLASLKNVIGSMILRHPTIEQIRIECLEQS